MAQLPSPQVKDTGTSTGSHNQNRTGLPYLNSKNQTDFLTVGILTPVTIKACKVNEPGPKVFSAVTARIMFADGRQLLYGLSLKNPNYARLCEMLTTDSDAWVEKKVNMTLEQDKFDEKLWVRVEAIPVTAKPAKVA